MAQAAQPNKISLDDGAFTDKQIAKTKELYKELLTANVPTDEDGDPIDPTHAPILFDPGDQKDLWKVLTAGRLNVCGFILMYIFHPFIRVLFTSTHTGQATAPEPPSPRLSVSPQRGGIFRKDKI